MLLPLDVLKIKMQTNPESIKGRGFIKLITEEGIASLYRGWGWTMARNAPGSFAVGLRARCACVRARCACAAPDPARPGPHHSAAAPDVHGPAHHTGTIVR